MSKLKNKFLFKKYYYLKSIFKYIFFNINTYYIYKNYFLLKNTIKSKNTFLYK